MIGKTKFISSFFAVVCAVCTNLVRYTELSAGIKAVAGFVAQFKMTVRTEAVACVTLYTEMISDLNTFSCTDKPL